jgi:hypothetical protein
LIYPQGHSSSSEGKLIGKPNSRNECENIVETIKYEITSEIGNIEIRKYPKNIIAKLEDPANGFNLLYGYIRGKTGKKQK